jgi:hypothetical protein
MGSADLLSERKFQLWLKREDMRADAAFVVLYWQLFHYEDEVDSQICYGVTWEINKDLESLLNQVIVAYAASKRF